ncbi:MAG: hypothetical protein KC620_12715 [Myxococcales bacterium]|nr:hypothetical protein [Myxococcales bacterium]
MVGPAGRATNGADPASARPWPSGGLAGLILALSLLITAGCVERRPLNRTDFDAAVPPPDAASADAESCAISDPTCDGHDDDCDGVPDEDYEGVTCGLGLCATQARCVSGVEIACRPGSPSEETCDRRDEDCDGATDEGISRGCALEGNACGGTQQCVEGEWAECKEIALPGDEVCDGADNDCDGAVDEALDRACALPGDCAEGIERCVDGRQMPCAPVDPQPERCDGRDEDCDGRIDEGDGPCGACDSLAARVCTAGAVQTRCDPDDGSAPSWCLAPLARIDAADGERRLGAVLVTAGDLDGDGVGDAVAGGTGLIAALSGATGRRLWTLNGPAAMGRAIAVGDLAEDDTIEVIAATDADQLSVFDRMGRRLDDWTSGGLFRPTLALAVVSGRLVAADPEFDHGPGQVGFFNWQRDSLVPDGTATGNEGETRFGERLWSLGGPLFISAEVEQGRVLVLYLAPTGNGRQQAVAPQFNSGPFGEGAVGGRFLPGRGDVVALSNPRPALGAGRIYLLDITGFIGIGLAPGGNGQGVGRRLERVFDPLAETLVVGAESAGEVGLWTYIDDSAARVERLPAPSASPSFGWSVAVGQTPTGDWRLFVGAPDEGSGGRVHLFRLYRAEP